VKLLKIGLVKRISVEGGFDEPEESTCKRGFDEPQWSALSRCFT